MISEIGGRNLVIARKEDFSSLANMRFCPQGSQTVEAITHCYRDRTVPDGGTVDSGKKNLCIGIVLRKRCMAKQTLFFARGLEVIPTRVGSRRGVPFLIGALLVHYSSW